MASKSSRSSPEKKRKLVDSQDSSAESCPPSPTLQRMYTIKKLTEESFAQVSLARNEVHQVIREYHDMRRARHIENEARVVEFAQLREELRLEKEARAKAAQVEGELRIRVALLEKELQTVKQDKALQTIVFNHMQRRRRGSAAHEGKRLSELNDVLIERKNRSFNSLKYFFCSQQRVDELTRMTGELTQMTGELTRLQESLSAEKRRRT